MLILTRKSGERIVIGQEITVTVLRSSHGRVLIGIDAPEEVPIRREELGVSATLASRRNGFSATDGL